MHDNPYAHPTSDPTPLDQPRRTSIAAIIGLICSLVCCLPFLPALGALLGAIGLRGTMRRDRPVGGRGLAIAAIILGLLFSAGQVGFALLANAQLAKDLQHLRFIQSLQTDDLDEARSRLSVDADSEYTDADLRDWAARLDADWGAFVTGPSSAGEFFFTQFSPEVGTATQRVQAEMGFSLDTAFTQAPKMFMVEFDNGRTPVCIIVKPTEISASADGLQAIIDAAYVAPDGSLVWLSRRNESNATPAPDTTTDPADDPTADPAPEPDAP